MKLKKRKFNILNYELLLFNNKLYGIKYYLIVVILLLASSCCSHKGDVEKIDNTYKLWFPFHTMNSFSYKDSSGLYKDTLFISSLDISVKDFGTECPRQEEYMNCVINSKKYPTFITNITVHPYEMIFDIQYNNFQFGRYHYFDTKIIRDAYSTILIDSMQIKNIIYRNIQYISDTSKKVELYYNIEGILKYKIGNETYIRE